MGQVVITAACQLGNNCDPVKLLHVYNEQSNVIYLQLYVHRFEKLMYYLPDISNNYSYYFWIKMLKPTHLIA